MSQFSLPLIPLWPPGHLFSHLLKKFSPPGLRLIPGVSNIELQTAGAQTWPAEAVYVNLQQWICFPVFETKARLPAG